MNPESTYDWPGWPLADNPYGEEFDQAARIRMVHGSEKLLPLLIKYSDRFGKDLLEVGPFFIPLLTPYRFPRKNISYWENDVHALVWLGKIEGTNALYQDANTILDTEQYDTVVASQILNYIDYQEFLRGLRTSLHSGGLLFLNNVSEYGLPPFFHHARPRNAQEVEEFLQENGYELIEKETQQPTDFQHQKHERLVGVWRKP